MLSKKSPSRPIPALIGCAALLCLTCATWASTPQLSSILPRGIQRGTETDLTISGQRFEDARELLVYSPGVTVTSFEVKGPSQILAHVKIDKDARVGEYCARIRSETGISELRTFYIGPFPIIPFKEAKPDKRGRTYYDFEHPQEITDLNVTIAGGVAAEQIQYFAVDMKKGQRLTAEVHGMRLGENFDPYIAIVDEKRFELAISDDTALAMQDPIASAIIPADGRYIIMLRDSSYGAGSHYLLHVGTFPRPRVAYPLGGRPGEELHVQYLGDVGGPIAATIKLPNKIMESYDVLPEQDGVVAPSANHITISDLPNVLEKEPNDDVATATAYDGELPVAFNGVIEKTNDIDYFRFKAKKGQQLDVRVLARVLRSPLDSVLTLYNEKGNVLASNDDAGGPDSYLRFGVPNDGEYLISVTDQLHTGGPDFAYRVEITPTKQEIVYNIPEYAQNSQERWTIPVPRGNRYATLMHATRSNVNGAIQMGVSDLPPGISVQVPAFGDSDLVPVVFEAAADAAMGGKLCELTAKPLDPKQPTDVRAEYNQRIGLVYSGNDYLYTTYVHTLAVSATKQAPYKLHLEQPKVPIVQGGAMDLKVTAERIGDFKGPIQVRLLFTPPSLSALPAADIEEGKTEAALPISAQQNAALKTWKICVVGMAEVSGQLWVSSELVDLTVGEPYLTATTATRLTAIELGKTGTVTYKLEQKTPFEGKAKCKLMGLPGNTTAEESEISATDTTVSFPVTVGEKTTVGRKDGMFVNVMIMKDGQKVEHNIGRGGVLRIDRPPQAVAENGGKPKTDDGSKPRGDKGKN